MALQSNKLNITSYDIVVSWKDLQILKYELQLSLQIIKQRYYNILGYNLLDCFQLKSKDSMNILSHLTIFYLEIKFTLGTHSIWTIVHFYFESSLCIRTMGHN